MVADAGGRRRQAGVTRDRAVELLNRHGQDLVDALRHS